MSVTPPEPIPADRSHDGGLLPDYEGYCFSNVPGTCADVLGVDAGPTLPPDALAGVGTGVENVVVVLVDGLGYRRFRRDPTRESLLGRLRDRGRTTPLTATVPSSTGAAIASVHTAAKPADHGVYGWDVYLPGEGTVVESFPFSVRSDCADGDRTPPIDPGELVRSDPVYPRLSAAGVEARVVQPPDTLGTAYADATFRGARQVPYEDPADAAATVRDLLEGGRTPSYTYLYLPQVDSVSHDRGVDSAAYRQTLADLEAGLSALLEVDPRTARETLVVVTADHGMTDLEPGPAGCIDLGSIPAVGESLARTDGGDPVPPFGDPRVAHLDLRPGTFERVRTALSDRGADVYSRREAVDLGLFGPPGTDLDGRCGDAVVVHDERKLVCDGNRRVVPKVGVHGGLTPAEMVVPFAAARLSTLVG